eukprot:641369-Prorocentrum_minimum.AAC.1
MNAEEQCQEEVQRPEQIVGDVDIPDDLRASLQSLTEEFKDVLLAEPPPDTPLQRYSIYHGHDVD